MADAIVGGDVPDPDRISTQDDLGQELTRARLRAGLTVRQVAKASGIPLSTVGGYFAGRHLPPASQPGLLPRVLAACGEQDPERVESWMQALARVRRAPGKRASPAVAPYRGLARFEPQDAGWFFGREELTLHLVRLALGASSQQTPLAVVGPSGSGKSSLLRAGLVPRLTGGDRRVRVITPGSSPLDSLAAGLSALWGPASPPVPDLVARLRAEPVRCAEQLPVHRPAEHALIVDQFEEMFAACDDDTERQAFATAICALPGTALVVIGLRADFYGHALRFPGLSRALQDHQIVVGAMSGEQVRRAIVAPAGKAGLEIEDGLVEVLLSDLRPRGAGPITAGHEVGALPLLSHALLATWERSNGTRLTVADYRASGGIAEAIARTAEAAYGALDAEAKQDARQLFLHLVHVAEGTRHTRARAPLTELAAIGSGTVAADVLEQFVERRLVTLDSTTAEITHAALLDAWPRLREWIDADRDDLAALHFITAAAQTWQETGREPAALLRGGRLAIARDWLADPARRRRLAPLTREFVDASAAEDTARHNAERRRTRRLRQLVTALTVLALISAGLAGYAFQQRRLAAVAEDVAQSRAVAIEAGQARPDDPGLAAQLSLAAYRISPTPDALASLLESSAAPADARMRDSSGVVQAVALAPDRTLLAVAAADGTLRLWNVSRPRHPFAVRTLLGRSRTPLYTVAFSPDGHLLAAAGAGGKIGLWRVSGTTAIRAGPPLASGNATIYSVTFAPDGAVLASGGADDTVRQWDITDPSRPRALGHPLTGPAGYVMTLAYAPGGGVLAAGSADRTVDLWDVSDPARAHRFGAPLTGPSKAVYAVAFSPDGHTLAVASRDSTVRLWNVTDPARPARAGAPLTGARDWVNAVAFSPDGQTLAAGGSDDRILLWDVRTGRLICALPHPQPVTSLAWDGPRLLISGAADGFARAWTVPSPLLRSGGPVNGLSFSPDGRSLAVGGSALQLWNPASHELTAAAAAPAGDINTLAYAPGGTMIATGDSTGRLQIWRRGPAPAPASPPQQASASGMVEFVAYRHDGRVLATAGDDGTVRLWSTADPTRPRLLATVHDSATYVFSVAFSPDGDTLAAASADNLTRLWNVADPARPRPLAAPLNGPASYAISAAFSPDGKTLAVGSADKTVRLWDVADPAHPRRLGRPLTGPGGYVYSVAFSPDGHTLAGGATDGTVWLWHLAPRSRPALRARLTGPSGHIYSVEFSPGGGLLAAAGSGGQIWLWDTSAASAARSVCASDGRPVSPAEWRTYVPGRPYAPPCRA